MSTLPAWAWALLLWALLLLLIALAQGRLLFGRAWRIRRTQPGPGAARRHTQAVGLERPGGVRLQGWLTAPAPPPAATPAAVVWRAQRARGLDARPRRLAA